MPMVDNRMNIFICLTMTTTPSPPPLPFMVDRWSSTLWIPFVWLLKHCRCLRSSLMHTLWHIAFLFITRFISCYQTGKNRNITWALCHLCSSWSDTKYRRHRALLQFHIINNYSYQLDGKTITHSRAVLKLMLTSHNYVRVNTNMDVVTVSAEYALPKLISSKLLLLIVYDKKKKETEKNQFMGDKCTSWRR